MAKIKTTWICQSCGYESPGYLGKCPECSSWGSFVEEKTVETKPLQSTQNKLAITNEVKKIKDITLYETTRFSTGMEEFDRVLGGGLVEGALVLIAGDPGIGKSTLILQSCATLANSGINTLYVSAEESAKQIKLRAQRNYSYDYFAICEWCMENCCANVYHFDKVIDIDIAETNSKICSCGAENHENNYYIFKKNFIINTNDQKEID